MFKTVQKTALTVAAMASLALGGSAIAGAASNTSTSTGTATTQKSAEQRPQRQALSADVAAKVKAAALDKVPGATVVRTEAGGPSNAAYHAHIKTSDGTLKVVLVNKSFEATAVQADNGGGPGGRGGHGHGGGGAGETALTGTTKEQVEAAVLAKYDGATVVRTETNNDSGAPYESHITTKDGKDLEVTVSKDFKIVAANEHPARP
jgi:uncharacterized membrane protein YkoI